MSEWIEVSSEEIEIDANKNEVNIYVANDEWGSIYSVLTFAQIDEIHEKIHKSEKGKGS